MILQNYLKVIENISPNDRELTNAGKFEKFLNDLKEEFSLKYPELKTLDIKHQPNNDKGGGDPDFAFYKQGTVLEAMLKI